MLRSFSQSSYLHLSISIGVFFVVGCGAGDNKPRVALEGRVTLNGKELPNGLVSLIPTETTGETAVAVIENGKFVIDRQAGPTPGKYKVIVESKQPTGRQVRDVDNPGSKIDEIRESVPAQYNAQSTLEVEVKPDTGQTLDFALVGSTIGRNGTNRR